VNLKQRIEREKDHARNIINSDESNWGWKTPAGSIRWRRRLEFLTQVPDIPPNKVLELGCGTGTFTSDLSHVFTNLTSIDISNDLLEIARQKAPAVEFRCMDAHDLKFADNSFDAVIGCSVLHHLDWTRALREAHRVLRVGGCIRFSEPNLVNPQIFLQKTIPAFKKRMGDSPDEYAFTKWEIARSLKTVGFQCIKATPYEFLHPSTPSKWIKYIINLEDVISRTPLRHIAGSLNITAIK